jgi:hypothetical protein
MDVLTNRIQRMDVSEINFDMNRVAICMTCVCLFVCIVLRY